MTKRSYLFVPASRLDRIQTAISSGADALVIDLEDAIPPDDKNSSRSQLIDWLAKHPGARVTVRINGAETQWFAQDLAVCRISSVESVMLPKAEREADLIEVSRASDGCSLLPLIETAIGFDNLPAISRAKGVERLAFGSIDFQHDLGIEGDGEELLHFRSALVLQSRLAGLSSPIDGVTVDLDDEDQLAFDTARARRLGFGAKLCIHPLQIAAVHRAFRPDADEVAWARRVVRAAEHARGAALSLDGKMVDKPVILRAQTLLARLLADDGMVSINASLENRFDAS